MWQELSGNVEHFVALERLKVDNFKVESICCLNEVSERQMNLVLRTIELRNLPMMTCLFKGFKNSFSLKNLTKMKIKGCEKLEFVFSTSIIMCLPQLLHVRIEECEELKHMIEDDLENKNSSNFMATKTVCFPNLQSLVVQKCKILKNVFPISICKELPRLIILVISESDNLEEIFVCEDGDEKVNIPNLEVVAFVNLPSLCQTQGIHFQAVQNRLVQHRQELSLTSAITEDANILNLIENSFGAGTHYHTVIFTTTKTYQGLDLWMFSFKIHLYILSLFLTMDYKRIIHISVKGYKQLRLLN